MGIQKKLKVERIFKFVVLLSTIFISLMLLSCGKRPIPTNIGIKYDLAWDAIDSTHIKNSGLIGILNSGKSTYIVFDTLIIRCNQIPWSRDTYNCINPKMTFVYIPKRRIAYLLITNSYDHVSWPDLKPYSIKANPDNPTLKVIFFVKEEIPLIKINN